MPKVDIHKYVLTVVGLYFGDVVCDHFYLRFPRLKKLTQTDMIGKQFCCVIYLHKKKKKYVKEVIYII